MTIRSRWTIDLPRCSIPTFLWGSAKDPLPDKLAYVDAPRADKYHVTFPEFRLWCQRLAVGLLRAGLEKGDRVLLFSPNRFFFPVMLHGTIMAEGVFSGVNPGYNAREVAYSIKDSEARFLFVHESCIETALAAAKEAGLDKSNIYVFDDGYKTFDGVKVPGQKGCKHWGEILAGPQEARDFQWRNDADMIDDTIILNYSSGTTGLPKGVEITHRNYIANTLQQTHIVKIREKYKEEYDSYRHLVFVPLYHAMAQAIFMFNYPHMKIPVFIMHKFDFEDMLKCIQRFRITDLQLAPPIAVRLTKSPLTKKYDLSSVKHAGCGAAPLGPESSQAFDRLWPEGQMNLKQGWGMTEVTCSALGWDPNKYSGSFGVGEPNANVECKIVDPTTLKEVPQGERGELWIRGENVMKRYWKKPEATKETIMSDGGWLRSGDIAVVDKDGIFFIVDRIKELIKVKGNQVAPAELEAQLLEHDAISDAAVIGVTIQGEEQPRAYCVKAEGQSVTEQEVVKFMETKVSKIKRLTGGVKFVDEIVKNPSGKILRKQYREMAQNEVGDAPAKESRL